MPTKAMTVPKSYRLTPDAVDLLEGIADKMGLNQTAVVETVIREKANKLGVRPGEPRLSEGDQTMQQRDMMRQLYKAFPGDNHRVVDEYAAAEMRGEVKRGKNKNHLRPAEYALQLWQDGTRKGWIEQ